MYEFDSKPQPLAGRPISTGWLNQVGTNGTGLRWWKCNSVECGHTFQSEREVIECERCEDAAGLAPQHRASHSGRIV